MKTLRIALGIAVASVAAGCSESKSQSEHLQSVLIDTVRTSAGYTSVQFPGKVKAAQDVNLSFRVSGAIKSYVAEEGQRVSAGQTLVVMDPTDYEVQLRATEAEYAAVKAQAERVIALHADGVVADVDNDKAVSGLQQMEAKLKHHRDQLAYTQITAPFDGYVQKKLFAEGEVVGAGMPVVQFISAGAPEVEINIPASEYIRHNDYGAAYATVDVAPGVEFALKTISVSPKANANQLHTMRMRVVGDAKADMVPGMNTMVTIATEGADSNRLTVPGSAVFSRDGRTMVYVYSATEGTVRACDVELVQLLSDGRRVVTSSKLRAGDIVVKAGTQAIVDGQRVKPISPATTTNVGGLL